MNLDSGIEDRTNQTNLYLEVTPQEAMEAFSVDMLEAGALTLALAAFLKDINGVGKTGVVNPGHLFGQVRTMQNSHLF